MSYLKEICRVTKPGGMVCFDAFDQSCFPDEIINKWIDSGNTYMNILPEEYIMDTFSKNGFRLMNSFYIAFNPGKARCFIFKKS
jgi:ubiquinone/menaquinone biosynthesis C-methylase UbiE